MVLSHSRAGLLFLLLQRGLSLAAGEERGSHRPNIVSEQEQKPVTETLDRKYVEQDPGFEERLATERERDRKQGEEVLDRAGKVAEAKVAAVEQGEIMAEKFIDLDAKEAKELRDKQVQAAHAEAKKEIDAAKAAELREGEELLGQKKRPGDKKADAAITAKETEALERLARKKEAERTEKADRLYEEKQEILEDKKDEVRKGAAAAIEEVKQDEEETRLAAEASEVKELSTLAKESADHAEEEEEEEEEASKGGASRSKAADGESVAPKTASDDQALPAEQPATAKSTEEELREEAGKLEPNHTVLFLLAVAVCCAVLLRAHLERRKLAKLTQIPAIPGYSVADPVDPEEPHELQASYQILP